MKARTKFEIAMAAGITTRTLARWLSTHHEEIRKMGASKYQHLLPPRVAAYVCHELGLGGGGLLRFLDGCQM